MKKNSTLFLVATLVYVLAMDELQRSTWLLLTPVKAEKNRTVPEFTEVKYQTSNYHKDLSLSRIQKDQQSVQKMFQFHAKRDQFQIDTALINLNSGKVADESFKVFLAEAIGESLIQGIARTSSFDNKFRKKDMAIIIKTNASANIEDSVVEVDSWVFFQRLTFFQSTGRNQ